MISYLVASFNQFTNLRLTFELLGKFIWNLVKSSVDQLFGWGGFNIGKNTVICYQGANFSILNIQY